MQARKPSDEQRPPEAGALAPDRLRPYISAMFDMIRTELATAQDKLTHLRRFL